ncbi:MAG: thioredoxin-disulfide reductase [Clostridia bacterium]
MFDIVIVGGGPAGLTSAIYARRAGKSVALIEHSVPGGQVGLTHVIENYPGFEKIDGAELATKMFEQASNLGTEIFFDEVLGYNLTSKIKVIKTHNNVFECKALIICTGASAKELNLKNEKLFLGRGVSYCATCDGNFFKDKIVAVVGGGNTSFEDCLYLANIAKKVYLIHRRDEFRGDKHTLEKIKSQCLGDNPKIELVLSSVISQINGTNKLESIVVENKQTNTKSTINVDGLFVAIGRSPDTGLIKGIVNLTENGFIITDVKKRTNIQGVFAGGDVCDNPLRQIVTACADGAICATSAHEYISQNFN